MHSAVAACRLQTTGSVVVLQGFGFSVARGIVPGHGSNPCPRHYKARFLTTGPPGKLETFQIGGSMIKVLKMGVPWPNPQR